MLSFVAAASLLLSSLSAFANDWRHITLVSEQGNTIQVDFTMERIVNCARCDVLYLARNVWVNVSGPSVSPGTSARVVYISKPYCSIHWYSETLNTLDFDLQYTEGGRLTTQIHDLRTKRFLYAYSGSTCDYKTELAVVIDGVWQKDPINQSSNFVIELPTQL